MSDEQLDTTAKPGTPAPTDDEVDQWALIGGQTSLLQVTKRNGVVIDVQVLPV